MRIKVTQNISKSKIKTAQGQVSIDHEPFSPQGEEFEDDVPRAEPIAPFVPDKKDKAPTGEYQDAHPYRRILIEQIKQDLEGYDALAKMGVVANGKLTNKVWPTNGHGFAGWSKPEVLDLLVWMSVLVFTCRGLVPFVGDKRSNRFSTRGVIFKLFALRTERFMVN